jgi:hypothetical protein
MYRHVLVKTVTVVVPLSNEDDGFTTGTKHTAAAVLRVRKEKKKRRGRHGDRGLWIEFYKLGATEI